EWFGLPTTRGCRLGYSAQTGEHRDPHSFPTRRSSDLLKNPHQIGLLLVDRSQARLKEKRRTDTHSKVPISRLKSRTQLRRPKRVSNIWELTSIRRAAA